MREFLLHFTWEKRDKTGQFYREEGRKEEKREKEKERDFINSIHGAALCLVKRNGREGGSRKVFWSFPWHYYGFYLLSFVLSFSREMSFEATEVDLAVVNYCTDT